MSAVNEPAPFAIDPFDPVTRRNPFPLYQRGRREHPVFAHSGFPVTSVFRYDDVQSILRDPETWSSRFARSPETAGRLPEPSLLAQDPPVHTRLRSLIQQAFTPRIIRRLETRLVEISEQLIDRALESDQVDLVAALTHPLPVTAISEIIGVPTSDRSRFKVWSDALVAGLGANLFLPPTEQQIVEHLALIAEMSEYFSHLADQRRREPREDLLTGLVHAEVEGSKLTHEEMIQMVMVLLVAGNETTTTLIGNCVVELLAHPQALEELRQDETLLPGAIEEVLRFASPAQMGPRFAARDVELHGVPIRAGSVILIWLGSANRDESVFPEADRFDIHRSDNRHLAFGFGIHYCIGANLARLETQVALRTLLAKTSRFELAEDAELPLHPSPVFRGFTRIPLRLHR